MAIGLEIEILVPVNQLTDKQIDIIKEDYRLYCDLENATTYLDDDYFNRLYTRYKSFIDPEPADEIKCMPTWTEGKLPIHALSNQYKGLVAKGEHKQSQKWRGLIKNIIWFLWWQSSPGRVNYGEIWRAPTGFRVDVDHDDRILPTESPPPFPPLEGGYDSILEIVMHPPASTIDTLKTTMKDIKNFTEQIEASTKNFTDSFKLTELDIKRSEKCPVEKVPIRIGPISYSLTSPGSGRDRTSRRSSRYSFQGSVQVNIGIDLRAYTYFIEWYAKSKYADPSRADKKDEKYYAEIRQELLKAVEVSKAAKNFLVQKYFSVPMGSIKQHAGLGRAGNLFGLQGWFTHLAIYLLGGKASRGGTVKNLFPVLLKNQNKLVTTYGWTESEKELYSDKKLEIVNFLLSKLFPDKENKIEYLIDLNSMLVSPKLSLTLADLFDDQSEKLPQTGKPILEPALFETLRTERGGAVYNRVSKDGRHFRGGMVVEFRTLPGFYTGANQWEDLGCEFLHVANWLSSLPGDTDRSIIKLLSTEKSSEFNYAMSNIPVLLNGMKVVFDRPVSVYPVTLESKAEAGRNGN